jgi:16S rRNA (cytidine1402-2'-O)-methyltransferase
LVEATVAAGLRVVPIPGASSVMAALVAAGMPLDRFTFFGFLARKGKERTETIGDIVASRVTAVLFEAPNRVGATLSALVEAGAGDRAAVVARELTQQFEEFRRGSVAELAGVYGEVDPKGEVVLVIAGAEKSEVTEDELTRAASALRASGKSPRDVMEHLVSALGAPRNLAYKIAHEGES